MSNLDTRVAATAQVQIFGVRSKKRLTTVQSFTFRSDLKDVPGPEMEVARAEEARIKYHAEFRQRLKQEPDLKRVIGSVLWEVQVHHVVTH